MVFGTVLYRESMIHVAGQWKGHHRKLVDQPELRKHAIIAYSYLCDKLDTADQAILHIVAKSIGGQAIIVDHVKQYTTVWSSNSFKSLASHYRHIYEEEYKSTPKVAAHRSYNPQESVAMFQKALRPVLENNLVLEQSKDGAGQGKFVDCFLCTDVPDEDLSWDPSQIDW